jgi:hypothetical protein
MLHRTHTYRWWLCMLGCSVSQDFSGRCGTDGVIMAETVEKPERRHHGMLSEAMRSRHLMPDIMDRARAGDVRHCFADITLAQERLGYNPTRSLETSLDELADWIARSTARDCGEHAKRELEAHGLVV